MAENGKQKQFYLQTQGTQCGFCLKEKDNEQEQKFQPSAGRDNVAKVKQAKNMAEVS